MNFPHVLERLSQAELTDDQAQRLFTMITRIFAGAIDARSPQMRPAGKAGLRAEKGYYRLLYLEGDFLEKIRPEGGASSGTAYRWDHLAAILGQLKDLPELQTQLLADIASALDAVLTAPPA